MSVCTDIHAHLLYGIDDGPRTPEEMKAMLQAEAENHVDRVVVTPHITPGVYPFDQKAYEQRLAEAQEIGKRLSTPVEVCGGSEVLFSTLTCAMLQDGRVPTMADTNIVLVEFSPTVAYWDLCRAVNAIVESGFQPMLAHVERYLCLVHRPARAKRLKEKQPVLYQVNANSFVGKRSFWKKRFIRLMIRDRLLDAVGTDAHNNTTRPVCMAQAYPEIQRLCGKRYAQALTNGHILFGNAARCG